MRSLFITFAALMTIATGAYADKSTGAYAGFGFGPTAYVDEDLTRDLVAVSGGGPAGNLDETDFGGTIYGGYRFNKIIGVEGSLTNYGEFNYRSIGGDYYDQKMRAFNIAANAGYTFLDDQLRPFGLLGLGIVDIDVSTNLPMIYSTDDTAGAVFYGFGVEYEPTPLKGVGFRAAYQGNMYVVVVSNWFGETDYAQDVGLLYMGVYYHF